MNYHRKDISDLVETTFRATEAQLREQHNRDLRESEGRARQTQNAAALLPAQADSYVRHIKALTVSRAQVIAEAYTAFGESCGEAGEEDLSNFYKTVLSARRSAFQGQSELFGRRTGVSLSQLPGLLRRFETDSHAALLEGRSILAKQRVASRVSPAIRAGVAGSPIKDKDDDRRFAQMAIEEALKSAPEDDRPHPKVGAVVVKNGKVLSKAHRGESQKSHAEYIALEQKLSDDLIAGATVYTTLEPCTTRKHPKIPCAQRLVDRKVARVVIGMLDPNPDIRGLGEELLSEAGIEIQLFPRDLRAQVEEMNREFIRAQKQKPPRSITNVSLDNAATVAARKLIDATWDLQKSAWSFYALHTRYRIAQPVGDTDDEERQIVEKIDFAFKVFSQDYDLPPDLSAVAKNEIGRINIALLNLKAFSMTVQEPDFKSAATQIQDACEQIRVAAKPYAYRSPA